MELGNQRASGNVEDRRGMGDRRRLGHRRSRHRPRRLLSRFRPEHRHQRRRAGQHRSATRAKCRRARPPTRRGSSSPRSSAAPRTCGARSSSSRSGQYHAPTLVLYDGAVRSACGTGQSAMGPFYCPNDEKLYIDLSFFRDLQTRFRAPGDFAQAYVIAHEVGHHVQKLTGTFQQLEARGRGPQAGANQTSVQDGVAGRLLRRRLGTPRGHDEPARRRRHRRSAQRGDGDRRRPAAEADAGPRRARVVHARLVGAARALVQARHGLRAARRTATRSRRARSRACSRCGFEQVRHRDNAPI